MTAAVKNMQTEHRRAPRHLLAGAVEVTDLESEKQIVTVARNLSLSGCFVATATPFRYGNEGQTANYTPGCDIRSPWQGGLYLGLRGNGGCV